MRQTCIAGAVLTSVLAGSALAADLPVKTPVAPLPRVVSDWTGFYIGVHGGYGWARPGISDLDLNDSPNVVSAVGGTGVLDDLHAPKLRGGVFGGHAGYNWQWGQRGVVGLEIDYSAANIKSTQFTLTQSDFLTPNGGGPDIPKNIDTRTLQSKLDSLASARARAGFLIGADFLLYGTGGAAWGHTKFTDTFVVQAFDLNPDHTAPAPVDKSVFASRASANHFGWVAGAGAEWKLWNSGLMLRVEYLHYDFGGASLAFDQTFTRTGLISGSVSVTKSTSFNVPLDRLTTDVVRGGLSYKF